MSRYASKARPGTRVDTWLSPGVNVLQPSSLSPAAWFDASDIATITSSGSPAKVSQWDDKSGNGRHVVQATAAAQPTTGTATQNGLNVLVFGGSQDLKKSSSAIDSDLTIFSVFRVITPTTLIMPGVLLNNGNAGRPLDRLHVSNRDNRTNIGTITVSSVGALFRTWTTFNVLTMCYSKTTSSSPRLFEYSNNQLVFRQTDTETHTVTDQKICIGRRDDGSTNLNGEIAEIIIFGSILSDAERTGIYNYLVQKWGI